MKSEIVQPHLVNGEDKWLVVVLFPCLENAAEMERKFRQLQQQKNFCQYWDLLLKSTLFLQVL